MLQHGRVDVDGDDLERRLRDLGERWVRSAPILAYLCLGEGAWSACVPFGYHYLECCQPPLCLARPVAVNGVSGLEKCDELYKNLHAAGDVV